LPVGLSLAKSRPWRVRVLRPSSGVIYHPERLVVAFVKNSCHIAH
jgi:hypothetical protein